MKQKVLFIILLLGVAVISLNAQYSFYESFEGSWPLTTWYMNGVARVSSTQSIPASLNVPTTAPHSGLYCVGMSTLETNYMITPKLLNPTQLTFFHKKDTGNHHFVVEYQVEDATPGPNFTGPWTQLLDSASAIGWNATPASINLTGLNNIYLRFKPTPPPPSPLKYVYFDDITIYESTVPVELSSFTAALAQQLDQSYFVDLQWTTQSETGTSGYNIFRNSNNEIATATQLTLGMIPATNTSLETNYKFTDNETQEGTWYYWLQGNDLDGSTEYYGPISVSVNNGNAAAVTSVNFSLTNFGPNPFNPALGNLSGAYSLNKAQQVRMLVYNVKGQKVRTLVNSFKEAGYHRGISWDGKDDSGRLCKSGMYYLTIITDESSSTRKIALIR